MGIKSHIWYFVQCDRCGYTPHSGVNPMSPGYAAAFETQEKAIAWIRSHGWLEVGDDFYCPRCAMETHGGLV